MEPENKDIFEIDMKEIFFILLHKLWIILIAGLLGAAIAWAYSNYMIKPVYTSSTKVYIMNKQDNTNLTLSDVQTGNQLTKDYMILVKSRPVTETVIKNLGLKMTSKELADLVKVDSPSDTRILEINVQNHDPALARDIADSMAEVSAVQMVSVMGIDKVNIMEKGNLPVSPSSPDVFKNTFIGGLFGFILVCAIIILAYLLDDNIRTTDDIEKYLHITALGMLPMEESCNNKNVKRGKTKRYRQKRKVA